MHDWFGPSEVAAHDQRGALVRELACDLAVAKIMQQHLQPSARRTVLVRSRAQVVGDRLEGMDADELRKVAATALGAMADHMLLRMGVEGQAAMVKRAQAEGLLPQ